MPHQVELQVNCYENTYRTVLGPGFFSLIEEQNQFRFARRVAILNNTDNPQAARDLADERIAAGEIDDLIEVAQHRDNALVRTGLTLADLGRIPF